MLLMLLIKLFFIICDFVAPCSTFSVKKKKKKVVAGNFLFVLVFYFILMFKLGKNVHFKVICFAVEDMVALIH